MIHSCFFNRYKEMRSGWVLAIGLLASNVLAMPVILLYGGLVSTQYENKLPKPFVYSLLEIGGYLWQECAMVVAALVTLYICTRRPAREIGYHQTHIGRNILLGMTVGSGTILFSFFMLLMTGQAKVLAIDIAVITSSKFWVGVVVFMAVGFGEETLTRGFMMTALKTTRKSILVLILPSLLFAMFHLFNPGFTLVSFINIFCVGILFSLLLMRTGSLWTPIIAHFMWNCLQGSILGLSVSGMKTTSLLKLSVDNTHALLSGSDYGAEGSLLLTLALTVAITVCVFLIKPYTGKGWTIYSGLPFDRKHPMKLGVVNGKE